MENQKVYKLEDFDKTLSDNLENQKRMAFGMNNGMVIESEEEEEKSIEIDDIKSKGSSIQSDIENGGIRQSILSGEGSARKEPTSVKSSSRGPGL